MQLQPLAQATTTTLVGQQAGPVSEAAFWAIVALLAAGLFGLFAGLLGVFAFIWTRDNSLRSELKTEITNLRTNDLADLKASVSEVSGQRTDLKNEIDKVGERVGSLSRDTNSRIDRMQTTIEGRFNTFDQRLQSGVEHLASRIDTSLESLKGLVAREELRSAIANLQSLVQAVSDRLIEISGPLGSAENRWQTVDAKLRDMEAELNRLTTTVANLGDQISRQAPSHIVRDIEDRFEDLRKKVQTFNDQASEILRQLTQSSQAAQRTQTMPPPTQSGQVTRSPPSSDEPK